MTANIKVNQQRAMALGILDTDRAIIFDLLVQWRCEQWCETIDINGQTWSFTAAAWIALQLPMLDINTDATRTHLKELATLGLIEYKLYGKKDMTRITVKGLTYLDSASDHKDEES